jgi:thiamine-phosphate pyrophosphorylase
VALITGAAGVHLGQTDLPPEAARRILGPDRIVGFSTHNLEQALEADRFGADYIDYIAVGPVFATTTKENPDPVLGVEGFAAICRELRKPVVAIGGITLSDAPKVLKAGAGSIAVVRDLLSAADIAARTRDWMNSLDYK